MSHLETFDGTPQTELVCMGSGDPRPAVVWFKDNVHLNPQSGNNLIYEVGMNTSFNYLIWKLMGVMFI